MVETATVFVIVPVRTTVPVMMRCDWCVKRFGVGGVWSDGVDRMVDVAWTVVAVVFGVDEDSSDEADWAAVAGVRSPFRVVLREFDVLDSCIVRSRIFLALDCCCVGVMLSDPCVEDVAKARVGWPGMCRKDEPLQGLDKTWHADGLVFREDEDVWIERCSIDERAAHNRGTRVEAIAGTSFNS